MKNCQVLDDRHILRESDIAGAEDQGKEVYFLLNLDGLLPFPGTLMILKPVAFSSQYFRIMVSGLLNGQPLGSETEQQGHNVTSSPKRVEGELHLAANRCEGLVDKYFSHDYWGRRLLLRLQDSSHICQVFNRSQCQ